MFVSEVIEKWSCLVGAQHSFTHMPRRSEAPINKNPGAQRLREERETTARTAYKLKHTHYACVVALANNKRMGL
jgi:hypothetical protein